MTEETGPEPDATQASLRPEPDATQAVHLEPVSPQAGHPGPGSPPAVHREPGSRSRSHRRLRPPRTDLGPATRNHAVRVLLPYRPLHPIPAQSVGTKAAPRRRPGGGSPRPADRPGVGGDE